MYELSLLAARWNISERLPQKNFLLGPALKDFKHTDSSKILNEAIFDPNDYECVDMKKQFCSQDCIFDI